MSTDPFGNAKWILNVTWEMQGIDVHLDTNIGKQLSALGHTLTAITGDLEETRAYSSDGNDVVDFDDLDNEATDTEVRYCCCVAWTSSRWSLPVCLLVILVKTTCPQTQSTYAHIKIKHCPLTPKHAHPNTHICTYAGIHTHTHTHTQTLHYLT